MEQQTVRQDQAFRQWPVMLFLLAGLFLVLHPYLGLVHDSRIYTLQALNLLRPDLYGNDVHLKFGFHDSYQNSRNFMPASSGRVGTDKPPVKVTYTDAPAPGARSSR